MRKHASSPYFLLSFIPAAAYWVLEIYFSLEIALIGGMLLGLLEMGLEKKFTGHVHTLSKLNLALILALGSIALIAHEGIWFKLQPTFTGLAVAGFLVYQRTRKKSLMLQMLIDLKQTPPLPPELYRTIEWHLCIFLFGFALFMAYVAVYMSTARWIFWKTAGFYLVFGGFMLLEIFLLRRYFRSKMK